MGHSQLFHNNGDGTFTDVSEQAGVTESCFGTPAVWWDYDNDGWMDIAQFVWSDHEDVIHTMRFGEGPADGTPMRVYHNNRDGTFTQVNHELGLNGCWGTMSANVADVNNDGYLDVVLGNGSPKMDRLDPMVLMENDGEIPQHHLRGGARLSRQEPRRQHGRSLRRWPDVDPCRVGRPVSGRSADDQRLLSEPLAGNYINIRLVGVKSNRSAIGAKVSVQAGGRWQYREVSGGSNFGCLPLEQHFGFGGDPAMDAIEIRWPSGLRQRFEGLAINRHTNSRRGSSGWREVYAKP